MFLPLVTGVFLSDAPALGHASSETAEEIQLSDTEADELRTTNDLKKCLATADPCDLVIRKMKDGVKWT